MFIWLWGIGEVGMSLRWNGAMCNGMSLFPLGVRQIVVNGAQNFACFLFSSYL